jgi:hypothetical protein
VGPCTLLGPQASGWPATPQYAARMVATASVGLALAGRPYSGQLWIILHLGLFRFERRYTDLAGAEKSP